MRVQRRAPCHLCQVGDAHAALGFDDLPRVRQDFAHDDLQLRGLARTIHPCSSGPASVVCDTSLAWPHDPQHAAPHRHVHMQ